MLFCTFQNYIFNPYIFISHLLLFSLYKKNNFIRIQNISEFPLSSKRSFRYFFHSPHMHHKNTIQRKLRSILTTKGKAVFQWKLTLKCFQMSLFSLTRKSNFSLYFNTIFHSQPPSQFFSPQCQSPTAIDIQFILLD